MYPVCLRGRDHRRRKIQIARCEALELFIRIVRLSLAHDGVFMQFLEENGGGCLSSLLYDIHLQEFFYWISR